MIEDILADYFSGEELSSEDTRVLREWAEKSNNTILMSALEKIHRGKAVREKLQQQPQEGMRLIKRKIERRRNKIRWYSMGSAACIIVLFCMTFFYLSGGHENEVKTSAQVVHANTSVQLKLSDGKIIPLKENQDKVVVSDSFVHVQSTNNTLVYVPGTEKGMEEFNTLVVPIGAEYSIVLSDGTKVYLNANSELRFPVTFLGQNREVYLRGEGYFEVAKDSVKTFKVHTEDMTAVVLGTSFNVRAYPDQGVTSATLEEGRLRVECGNHEYSLLPGNQVCLDKETGKSELLAVNTKYYTSWKDGYYLFNELPLEDVMDMLVLWYGLEVVYVDEEVKQYEFSGRLKRYDDYHYLLGKLEETGGIEFVVNSNKVTVRKK